MSGAISMSMYIFSQLYDSGVKHAKTCSFMTGLF